MDEKRKLTPEQQVEVNKALRLRTRDRERATQDYDRALILVDRDYYNRLEKAGIDTDLLEPWEKP